MRDDHLIGKLDAGQEDHERRISELEDDMKGVKRFQTSFFAILAAAGATVTIWKVGLIAWIRGG